MMSVVIQRSQTRLVIPKMDQSQTLLTFTCICTYISPSLCSCCLFETESLLGNTLKRLKSFVLISKMIFCKNLLQYFNVHRLLWSHQKAIKHHKTEKKMSLRLQALLIIMTQQ